MHQTFTSLRLSVGNDDVSRTRVHTKQVSKVLHFRLMLTEKLHSVAWWLRHYRTTSRKAELGLKVCSTSNRNEYHNKKNNGSVVNRESPRKICVPEDGRMTETCSAVK
jgi:hypothetical protein